MGREAKDRTSPWIGGAIAACMVVGICAAALSESDNSTTVEVLSTSDGQALAGELAKAYDVQHVCYGWELSGAGSSNRRVGSNLGDGAPLNLEQLPTQCARAVTFVGEVTYTSSSSEQEDYATLRVRSMNIDLPYTATTDLARFGVGEAELIEDPVATVARAVLALPLLVAEYGLAPPLPQPSGAATATAAAPAVGSDFWRDRGWLLLVAIGLMLCAPLAVFLGHVARQRDEDRRSVRAEATSRRNKRRKAEGRQRLARRKKR